MELRWDPAIPAVPFQAPALRRLRQLNASAAPISAPVLVVFPTVQVAVPALTWVPCDGQCKNLDLRLRMPGCLQIPRVRRVVGADPWRRPVSAAAVWLARQAHLHDTRTAWPRDVLVRLLQVQRLPLLLRHPLQRSSSPVAYTLRDLGDKAEASAVTLVKRLLVLHKPPKQLHKLRRRQTRRTALCRRSLHFGASRALSCRATRRQPGLEAPYLWAAVQEAEHQLHQFQRGLRQPTRGPERWATLQSVGSADSDGDRQLFWSWFPRNSQIIVARKHWPTSVLFCQSALAKCPQTLFWPHTTSAFM